MLAYRNQGAVTISLKDIVSRVDVAYENCCRRLCRRRKEWNGDAKLRLPPGLRFAERAMDLRISRGSSKDAVDRATRPSDILG
jgi:hypothetical protein